MNHEIKIEKAIEDMNKTSFAAITHFPTPISSKAPKLSEEEKISLIEEKIRDVMIILGLDLSDESLQKTPYRIAKMYVKEIFKGLDSKNFPDISVVQDRFYQDNPGSILVKDISLNSFCEHHFVPIQGKAHISYIPNGKIIGLSKINRIVDYFAKRPQIQERLTAQIADSLSYLLETKHVAVTISAYHSCVSSRGIQDQSSSTTTHVFLGDFQNDPKCRRDFFSSIQ